MTLNKIKYTTTFAQIIGACFLLLGLNSCKKELPGEGSIPDLTPPSADFNYVQLEPSNYLEVTFTNASVSATAYLWDFGDGNSSLEFEPVHVYAAQGTYTVKLTASDKLGKESTKEMEITLEEPSAFVPAILESGFEDDDLPGGGGDGRDSWRNSDLGGVIQITSSPVNSGSQAAKLTGSPSDKRIGYQLLTVTANTVYDLKFFYTMKDSPTGFLTVSVIAGPVTSHQEALDASIGSITVNDQTNPAVYIQETLSFFTGNNTEVAIYFFNDGSVETRLDDFSIDVGSGPIPVTANFTYEADTTDYKKVRFTNTSLNADSYSWDFGDGNMSSDASPTHTYTADGTYTVSMTASNTQGGTDTKTTDVVIAMPSSTAINNPSFDDEPVRDDNRIAWRNNALETDADVVFGSSDYMLQTSTTNRTGSFAGKLPTAENSSKPRRWLYQEVAVTPNTNYEISGWMRNKDANVGSTVTFEIYDAPFSTASTIGDATKIIKSEDFDAASGHDTNVWTEAKTTFNSGSSTTIVLFIYNDYTLNGDPVTEESETFLDDFSIIQL